jgi:hypothetical protein
MKTLIDDAFYCEQQRWGTWNSYDVNDVPILTSLTEDECIKSTRFILKLRQENRLNENSVSYGGSMDYKL